MLCKFCSNIDLDQLETAEGYGHHSSCADLVQSAQIGCESCQLIWESQWVAIGGDLLQGYDQGALETQIIARVVNQKAGRYEKVRFGQEQRFETHKARRLKLDIDVSPDSPYLWCFLIVAANNGV